MLFITNRFPTESIQTKIGRKFDFDLGNNAASNSLFFCERKEKEDYTEIGSKNLLQSLRESKYRQILLFIHGFSNLPEDVFQRATEFQKLADKTKDKESLVVPLIWPCDNDEGIVQDYWDDQKSADLSGFSFARLLDKFDKWRNSDKTNPQDDPCLKRISVLAHSMGNRVLRETLAAWRKYDLARGVPLIFRNTYLVAADVVNETLEPGERGEAICHASRNVIVYYASDDLALRASKAANLKNGIASRRLGHTGPERMDRAPSNVYAIDCDDVNTAYDFPKGHTYFLSGPSRGIPGVVFRHIFGTLIAGRVFPDDQSRRTMIIEDSVSNF